MMIAIIRLRGSVGLRPRVRKTLELLGIHRNNEVAVVELTPDIKGMVMAVKDYVTWGEVSKDVLKKLEALAVKGDKIKRYRLHPPRGGFKKTIKRPKPDGELGYRGDEINALIERMLP